MNKTHAQDMANHNQEATAIKSMTVTEAYAPRNALLNCFYRAAFHRVMYAYAPAGSGKTVSSLLWLAECGHKAIWINLDKNDNTSTDFYRQMAFGIASAQPNNKEMDEIIKSPSFTSTPIAHVIRLLDSFQTDEEMYALVFDDMHHINVGVLLKSLAAILQKLPPSFVVLFLSREKPPKYLREIIKSAAIIKPEQFLFTEDEIRGYFERMGRPVSPDESKVIHASTGGMPIGVSAVAKTGEIKLGQDGFDAANFLTTQLLNEWSQDMQDFMQKTCVTDEITPELAERLTGCKDSKAKLDWLCDTNAYITKIGETTYRYHRMFLDFLRSRSGCISSSVYKIAGDYYIEKGNLYSALPYYIRSGAPGDIALNLDLILQHGPPSISVIEQYRNTMRIDIESISENDDGINQYFYIWRLWKHYVMGDAETVRACFDRLDTLNNNQLAAHPVINNLMIAVRYLDIRRKLSDIQRDGEMADGTRYFEECHDMQKYTLNMFTMNMPFVSRSSRDSSEYADRIENIDDFFSGSFRKQLGAHYVLYVPQLKAELYYEKNMLAEAMRETSVSLSVSTLWDNPDYVFSHHMICASIAFASGNTKKAMQLFNDMDVYIKENGYEFLIPNLFAFKTKLMLCDADKDAAQAWLNLYFVTEPVEDLLLYEIYRHFTTARAYIVLGRHSDALDLLEKLKRLGIGFMRPLDVAEAGVLKAIAEWAEGKKDLAVAVLEDALTVMQTYGFSRTIVGEGGAVMPVLKRLASKVGRQTYIGILDSRYVNEISIAANQFAKLHVGLIADAERNVKILKLSKRQKQVLNLMSKGYKNESIAEELGLDIMTVRGHLTKAYRKLGVHTGIEAVFKAREMGIVE